MFLLSVAWKRNELNQNDNDSDNDNYHVFANDNDGDDDDDDSRNEKNHKKRSVFSWVEKSHQRIFRPIVANKFAIHRPTKCKCTSPRRSLA